MNIPELIERLREWPTGLDLTDIDKAVEALLAQQVCLKQKDAALQRCTKFTQEDYDALALQPDLSALREHDAEVILKFAKWTGPIRADIAAFRYIERIRKGE